MKECCMKRRNKAPVVFSDDLIKLLPKMQRRVMAENPMDYAGEIERMNKLVETIPRLDETDGLKGNHPLSLHYYVSGCDWYISEWDREDTMFGYAILNGDYENSEWGYIRLSELMSLENIQKFSLINLDLHCNHATVEAALFAKDKEYFRRYDPDYIEAQANCVIMEGGK
jgi:hypothetical protein